MSQEPKRTDNAVATVTSLVAAAAVAAASTGLTNPVSAAGLAVIPSLLDSLRGYRERKLAARWRKWLAEYVRGASQDDVDLLEAQLSAEANDPAAQDVVLEGARALEDALAEVVVPHLARLTRIYRTESRQADVFFRGVRRTLCELSAEEFVDLRELVRVVCLVGDTLRGSPVGVPLYYERGAPTDSSFKITSADQSNHSVDVMRLAHAPRLFRLLKMNELAMEASGPRGVIIWGISIELATVRRLWPVIEP